MLIQLDVSNILSFGSGTSFSMRAGKITKQHRNHVRCVGRNKVVRGAVVFGANAAGKSNLLKVLALVERMVIANDCRCLAGKQFALRRTVDPLMSVSVEYECNDQVFRYFVCTDGVSVGEERLDLSVRGGYENIFTRKGLAVELGDRLKGYAWYEQRTFMASSLFLIKLWDDGLWDRRAELPESKLMLNACRGMKQFAVIDSTKPSLLAEKYYAKLKMEDYRKFLVRLLSWADTGITNVGYRKLEPQEADMIINHCQNAIPDEPKEGWSKVVYDHPGFYLLVNDAGTVSVNEICCMHGSGRQFRASDESQGTIKLIQLSSLLYQLKKSRLVWCVDEFDSQFHTKMNQELLKWYMDEEEVGSQLIITAHDTNLLTNDIWRSDEVWFVEKAKNGESVLSSLYTYSPRFDKKLAKGYLSNAYGALPAIKQYDFAAIDVREGD